MIERRAFHTATALGNGAILFAGGEGGDRTLDAAELYDPGTHTWSAAAPMAEARAHHAAVLLLGSEGDDKSKVLVAGGAGAGVLSSAELYDPVENAWSTAGIMAHARRDGTVTLLLPEDGTRDPQVLVAGGDDGTRALASAERYEPTPGEKGAWVPVDPMTTARTHHTATLLVRGKASSNGKVLVAGGDDGTRALDDVELYDPTLGENGAWVPVDPMTTARTHHAATLLHNGQVLVVGGDEGGEGGAALASAELYDPTIGEKGAWSAAAAMKAARTHPTATLLSNGTVLVVGGLAGAQGGDHVSGAELYEPRTNTWSDADSPIEARDGHTATWLATGEVLIAGGQNGAALDTAELHRAASQCETLDDCPRGLVCNEEKECEPPQAETLANACATADGRAPAGRGALTLGVVLLAAAVGRRLRAPGRRLQSRAAGARPDRPLLRGRGERWTSEARRSIQ